MRRLLTVFVLIALAAPSQADPKTDAEIAVRFQLELAKAKALQREPIAAPKAHRMSFEAAFKAAMKSGNPVLIHVNSFDCGDVCGECRDCLHADAPEVKGDSTPRLIVAYPRDGWLYIQKQFTKRPTLSAVRAELKAIPRQADCPPGN